jgi:signal transduction histidine kinase
MYEFLKNVSLFADLSDDDLRLLCKEVEEVDLHAGEELFSEGSPGDRAYIIREGELEIIKVSGSREVLIAVRKPGEVIGEIALLEETTRMASVRARTESSLIAIRKEQLEHLLETSLPATTAMFYTVLDRLRGTQAMLRQSEKMAQLGTLTAGVAHELNNPASAVRRSSEMLKDAIQSTARSQSEHSRLELSPETTKVIHEIQLRASEQASRPPELDALARSDAQERLEGELEGIGIAEPWSYSSELVDIGLEQGELSGLAEHIKGEQMEIILRGIIDRYRVQALVNEIEQGAERISAIVGALKSYSYLDQAPVQNVDIHKGIDDTLIILQSKIRALPGVRINKTYAKDLPMIFGYGSELNQVWTNLLDNALDAIGDEGVISIITHAESSSVIVEIVDNGTGIPEDIMERIFEPFFTTKPPGAGTGLGLDISYNIVVNKHRGDIKVESEPGRTCFQVWLPVNFQES